MAFDDDGEEVEGEEDDEEDGERRLQTLLRRLEEWESQVESRQSSWHYTLEGESSDDDDDDATRATPRIVVEATDLATEYLDALYSEAVLLGRDRGEALGRFARTLSGHETARLLGAIKTADGLQDKYRSVVPRELEQISRHGAATSSSPRKAEGAETSRSADSIADDERNRLVAFVHGASGKSLVEDLRSQESMLQLILCLEVLARRPASQGKRATMATGTVAKGKAKRVEPGLDVGRTFELLKDRLAIWQALSNSTALAITSLLVHVLRPMYATRSRSYYDELVAAFGEAPAIDARAGAAQSAGIQQAGAAEAATSPLAPRKRRKKVPSSVERRAAASPTLKRLLAGKTGHEEEDHGRASVRKRKGKPKRLDVEQLRQQVEERAKKAAQRAKAKRPLREGHRRAESPSPMMEREARGPSADDPHSTRPDPQRRSRSVAAASEAAHASKPRPGSLVRNRSITLFKSREVSMNRRATLDRSSSFGGAHSGPVVEGRAGGPLAGLDGSSMRRVKTMSTSASTVQEAKSHDGFGPEQASFLNVLDPVRMSPRKLHRPRRLDLEAQKARSNALVAATPQANRIVPSAALGVAVNARERARVPVMVLQTPQRGSGPVLDEVPASLHRPFVSPSVKHDGDASAPSRTPTLSSGRSFSSASSFVEPPRFPRPCEAPILVQATPQKTAGSVARAG